MKGQCLMKRCPQSHESSPDSPSCPVASYRDLSQSYNSTKELQIKYCNYSIRINVYTCKKKNPKTNYIYISMQRLLYGNRKQCIIITC